MRIIVGVIFFSQQSFCMDRFSAQIKKTQFSCFTELLPEQQLMVFKYSNNKSNLQKTNKEWYEQGSIQSPSIFVNDFCQVDRPQMIRILLNAAYNKHHKGIENILKNSSFLMHSNESVSCIENRHIYQYVDTYDNKDEIIDIYSIAHDNADKQLWQLLESYHITSPTEHSKCKAVPLIMACLAGNSDLVECHLKDDRIHMQKMLKLAIDFDHGKCVAVLIANLYDDSNLTDIVVHFNDTQALFNETTLKKACLQKSFKALKALLDNDSCNMNKFLKWSKDENGYDIYPVTLLDKIVKKAAKDASYDSVAVLLYQYGARTGAEIEESNQAVRYYCHVS